MKLHTTLSLITIALLFCLTQATLRPQLPVIGILSTPSDYPDLYEPETYSYIKETYPNFIRKAGGYPIFIPYNLSDSELFPLLDGIHAVLLIGGDTKLWTQGDNNQREFTPYVHQVQKIISYVQKANNESTYLPMLGICEGMEVIMLALTNDPYLLDNFDNLNTHGPVLVTQEGKDSKMFGGFSQNQLDYLEESGTLFYSHEFGYNLSSINKYEDLQKTLRMTAIAADKNSDVFVAAMESRDWPLYMVMFHPERIEWEREEIGFEHHDHVVDFTQGLADFFVKEAMKNKRELATVNDWERWDFKNYESVMIEEGKPKVYLAECEHVMNDKKD